MQLNRDGDYVGGTIAAIRAKLARGRPGVEAIAGEVGLSVRTLQRHLGLHGTTYSRLLRAVRRDAACELLQGTGMPLAAIAASLGYSELSSFTRAFRSWTGMSPSAFRRSEAGRRGKPAAPDVRSSPRDARSTR